MKNGQCHVIKMKPSDLQVMLEKQYGKKLQPINHNAKPPVNYRLTTNDSYEDEGGGGIVGCKNKNQYFY